MLTETPAPFPLNPEGPTIDPSMGAEILLPERILVDLYGDKRAALVDCVRFEKLLLHGSETYQWVRFVA